MLGLLATARPLPAALPAQVTVTQPASLELLSGTKVTGTVQLSPGQMLDVVDLSKNYVVVRYRNLNGRILAASTNLPKPAPAAPPPVLQSPTRPPAAAKSATGVPAAPPATYLPATPMEKTLAGKLVALEGGALRPCAASRLAGVKFYAFYFSASWCPPCREFTPGFVDAYGKIRALFPEFEVVLVNRDRSAADMLAYMRGDAMKWPALRWEDLNHTDAVNRYAGSGIPDLVLVDENGKVLSDSFRWGSYAGPDAVLDDTWKILREYRRKNPRTKT